MVDIITLANQLNKDMDYIKQLCYNCEIPIHADKDGEFISDEDAQLFIIRKLNNLTGITSVVWNV